MGATMTTEAETMETLANWSAALDRIEALDREIEAKLASVQGLLKLAERVGR